MIEAHYMTIRSTSEEDPGPCDRVGGLPTYLPPQFPTSGEFGTEYCFLLQLVSMDRLGLKGWRCLQLYQSGEVDDGDDPTPMVVLLPLDAPANDRQLGRPNEAVRPGRIEWDVRLDPDEFPKTPGVTDELTAILTSKVGGTPPAMEPPVEGARFLGQIAEALGDFNFGGCLLTLWQTPDGQVVCVAV